MSRHGLCSDPSSSRDVDNCPGPQCKLRNLCDLAACQSEMQKCEFFLGHTGSPSSVGRVSASSCGTELSTSQSCPSPASFLTTPCHPLWASRTTLLVIPCIRCGRDSGRRKPSLSWWWRLLSSFLRSCTPGGWQGRRGELVSLTRVLVQDLDL